MKGENDILEKVLRGLECCLPAHDPDCDLCPYDSVDLRCRAQLRDDVVELLKAQEPRVLSLEEYKATAEKPLSQRDPVWLQWRHGDSRWAIPQRAYEGYGQDWIAWTGKPSEGQREAVKWE